MVSGQHHKIGPASVVDPNAAPVSAPAIAFGACGIAMLCDQPHLRASRLHAAVVLVHVVGTARNRLSNSVVVPVAVIAAVMIRITIGLALILKDGTAPNREIRAASMVYPDAPFVGSPAVTLGASRCAVLRQ